MNQGLLKTAKIAESVAYHVFEQTNTLLLNTSVAADSFIESLLPQIFKKARPMQCETQSLFTQLTLKEYAEEFVRTSSNAGLDFRDGLAFMAKLEFDNDSHGYLLLRTNKEIEAVDTDLKSITASDFKKGLCGLLVHFEANEQGEVIETCYACDTHFKKADCDEWNLFLNLIPIVDDYIMTLDLITKLSVLIRESYGLNGLQRLQLQQICLIELCNQVNGEFSIADFLRKIQYIEPFKALDFSPLSDLGLFVVDIRAVNDCKKMLSVKLKLSNGMIISYNKNEMPCAIRDGYEMRKIDINNTSNAFEVEFKTEIFE